MLDKIPSQILCVTRDRLLGATRQMVLQTRFAATTIYDLSDMGNLRGMFDLVILCHSLTQEECAMAYTMVKRCWPAAQVLALSVQGDFCRDDTYDQVLIGMPEPNTLLGKLSEMISSNPVNSHEAWLWPSSESWGLAQGLVHQEHAFGLQGTSHAMKHLIQ